jgi:hypothetical protein
MGTRALPEASTDSSVSNDSRLRNASVVFAERIGLSVLGERCVATRSVPEAMPGAPF